MRTILFALTLLLTMATTAMGQEAPAVWKEEAPPHITFSITYRLYVGGEAKPCFINVKADGKGIVIVSRIKGITDGKTTSIVLQQIDIKRPDKKGGKPKIDDQRFIANMERIQVAVSSFVFLSDDLALGPYLEDTAKPPKAPDVFRVNYLPKANLLPAGVRKLFFGYAGVH